MYRARKVQKFGRAATTRLSYSRINNSGSFAMLLEILRASSRVSSLKRRPMGQSKDILSAGAD